MLIADWGTHSFNAREVSSKTNKQKGDVGKEGDCAQMFAGIFANMVSLTNGGRHLIVPSLGPLPQEQCVS